MAFVPLETDPLDVSLSSSIQFVVTKCDCAFPSTVDAEKGSKSIEKREKLNANVAYAQHVADEQSIENEDALLIDRFLQDEEKVPSCIFEDSDSIYKMKKNQNQEKGMAFQRSTKITRRKMVEVLKT